MGFHLVWLDHDRVGGAGGYRLPVRGSRTGDRERRSEQRIGAQTCLLARAVELHQDAVHLPLVVGITAVQHLSDISTSTAGYALLSRICRRVRP